MFIRRNIDQAALLIFKQSFRWGHRSWTDQLRHIISSLAIPNVTPRELQLSELLCWAWDLALLVDC